MATAETRTQILDAAEQLFAERGYRGTSVRAITDLAHANLAAVGYHFGSKSELLAAVARRVTEPITAAQSAGLDRLLARSDHPSVSEILEAFAQPLVDAMKSGTDSSTRTSRVIAMILTDPANEVRAWTGQAQDTVRDRFHEAFAHALPALSSEELWFRMRGIIAVVAVDRVEYHNQNSPAAGVRPTAAVASAHAATGSGHRWAISFLAAAMGAPPSV
jgi:AcrR family transcriptional regulator